MIEIERATIRLGEKDFEIQTISYIRSKPWKKRLMADIYPLFDELKELSGMQFNSPADLLNVFPVVETIFVDAIDMVFHVLIAYSPILEADREYIENNATDKQILAAFQEVLKLTDPFGMIDQMNRKIGLKATGIS